MKIKVLFERVKEIKYIESVLNLYGGALKPGKYLLFPCFRALCVDDSEVYNMADKYFGNKSFQPKFQPIVRMLNKMHFFKNKKMQSGTYEAVYIANNYDAVREVKLFSFRERKILVICTSEKECQEQISLYDSLKGVYALPKVSKGGQYPTGYEISMVDLLEVPNETCALEEILKKTYIQLINSDVQYASADELLKFDYECSEMNEILSNLQSRITKIGADEKMPVCLQHGDLSTENLIYGVSGDEKGFWWIDWEHRKDRFFLYDFFFYIINTAYYTHDYKIIGLYFEGYFDALLDQCLRSCGIEYRKECRADYFLVMAICFLKERVCDKGNLETLKKYYQLIQGCLMQQHKIGCGDEENEFSEK